MIRRRVKEQLTINCHKEELLRLDNMEQLVEIAEYTHDHLVFSEFDLGVVAVCAVVYDAVHV